MGATSSLMVAAHQPDLVRALVFAEPVLVSADAYAQAAQNPQQQRPNLADMASRRRQVFPSMDDARGRYRGRGAFTTWPDEMLDDYLRGGMIPTGNGDEVRLACSGEWEAVTFRNAPLGIARLAANVKCPLTVLHAGEGSTDGTARASEVELVKRLKPDAKIVAVPRTTHFLPMENPQAVRDEILRFA